MKHETKSQARPMRHRLIVFSVPVRRKLQSGIYVGNAKRGSFGRTEEVWVVAVGSAVKESFRIGQRCILSDAFELEPSDLDLWHEHCDRPEFASLAEFVASVDGEVRTQIVSEWSVLAVDDD